MKHLNKIFGLSLATLSATPALAGVSSGAITQTLNSNEIQLSLKGEKDDARQACTVAYLGKKCTADGKAYIARANDCSPKAHHMKLQHFKRDEIANKTFVGVLGLRYTMPAHTYAYTSCPLSQQACDNPTWGSGNWENHAINEMGVGTSATLTCATNPKVLALENESFVKEGVCEELLTQIMAPQAATAKEAMEVAAKAIDKYGAQDANIIISIDQNEAWLMEIYSRHQYCAVKMPDDKVCIAGNEFILNSLDELGINASNKDQMCILSPKLFETVKDTDFVKYKEGTLESEKDVFHLDLFNTYARPLTWTDSEGVFHDTDGSHMRTWRGYSMWDQSPSYPKYGQGTKYAPFLTPKDANGNARTDMTVYDIMQVYRDEYDDIIDPNSERFDPLFKQKTDNGTIRTIAVQQTRQVHILTSDPNRPKWIAADEWYTPDSANYVPFVQINNAMTKIEGEYGFVPERFDFDERCASVVFREINKLAYYNRKNYGYPLQDFWRVFEYIYCQQMNQVTEEAAKLSQNDATAIMNNFNKHVRDIYMSQVKKTAHDLMWHVMDEPHSRPKQSVFVPLIDLETYVKDLGWKNYNFDGKKATFEKDAVKCEYTISSGVIYGEGTFSMSTGDKFNLRDSVENNKVFVEMAQLNKYISKYCEIKKININDYKDFNHLVWIIPVSCVLAIGLGVGVFFIVRHNKNKHKHTKK